MSKKKDSLKPWLSRPTVNRSVTLPLTRPLTQRLSNLNEFHPNELDPYLLFDAQDSMIGTLENPTLDLDPSKPDTLNVITATRAGVATYTDVNGNIATAPANTVRVDYTQGAELTPTKFQNIGNTDFTSSLWVKNNATVTFNQETAPDGTQTAAKYFGSGTGQDLYYNSTFTGPFTYSLFVKYINAPYIRLRNDSTSTWFNLTTGSVATKNHDSASIEDVGDSWFRISVTVSSASSLLRAYIHPHATDNTTLEQDGGSFYLWGPQLEEGTTASPFVANTTLSPKFITGATFGPRVPMILVEPSATNTIRWSEDSTGYNYGAGITFETSDVLAPNGQASAFKMTPDGSSVLHRRGSSYSGSYNANDVVTTSVWLKTDGYDYFLKVGGFFGAESAMFDSLDGSVQSTEGSVISASSEDYGNGWFRYKVTYTFQNQINNGLLYSGVKLVERDASNNPVESFDGTGDTTGVLVYGTQFELGRVATSYIPTDNDISGVTRAADNLVISGSAFSSFYNQSEGTFYLEFEPRELSTSITNTALELSNGTGAERILSHVDSQIHAYFVDGGNVQANLDGGTNTVGVINRLAFSYKANNIQVSVGGGAVVSDTSASIPTVDRLIIGNQVDDNTRLLNGHIKRLIYWPYHSDSL